MNLKGYCHGRGHLISNHEPFLRRLSFLILLKSEILPRFPIWLRERLVVPHLPDGGGFCRGHLRLCAPVHPEVEAAGRRRRGWVGRGYVWQAFMAGGGIGGRRVGLSSG